MRVQSCGAKPRNFRLHTPCYTVLRSSKWREASEARREALSTLQIKLHSPCYTPLADLFGVVFANLVPRRVGLV